MSHPIIWRSEKGILRLQESCTKVVDCPARIFTWLLACPLIINHTFLIEERITSFTCKKHIMLWASHTTSHKFIRQFAFSDCTFLQRTRGMGLIVGHHQLKSGESSAYKLKRWLKSRRWVAQKVLRWNVLFLFDAHAVLFPLPLLSGFCYVSSKLGGIEHCVVHNSHIHNGGLLRCH